MATRQITGAASESEAGDAGGRPVVMRLDATGAPDATFGDDGLAAPTLEQPVSVSALALREDGSTLVGGGSACCAVVIGQGPDGAVDQSFGEGGVVTLETEGGRQFARLLTHLESVRGVISARRSAAS